VGPFHDVPQLTVKKKKSWRHVQDDDRSDRDTWAKELDGGGANSTPRWWSFSR
jgi:hypothetical protein